MLFRSFVFAFAFGIFLISVSAQLLDCGMGNTGQITILSDNPVGFYPLNELQYATIYNYGVLGDIANGIYVGEPQLGLQGVSPPPNKQDPAVGFNQIGLLGLLNNGQYGVIPFVPELSTSSMSVELWSKPQDLSLARYSYSSLQGNTGMAIYTTIEAFWICELGTGTGTISLTGSLDHISLTTTWSHVVCLYNATTSTASLYLDGVHMHSRVTNFVPKIGRASCRERV